MSNYKFKFVLHKGQGIFNNNGEWVGNYTAIEPQHGFWVNVSGAFSMPFQGATLNPTTLTYTLETGWNLLSYPYQVDKPFGSGAYLFLAAISIHLLLYI